MGDSGSLDYGSIPYGRTNIYFFHNSKRAVSKSGIDTARFIWVRFYAKSMFIDKTSALSELSVHEQNAGDVTVDHFEFFYNREHIGFLFHLLVYIPHEEVFRCFVLFGASQIYQ